MFKGFYYGLCLLLAGCQAQQSPAHDPHPVSATNAEPANARAPSPTIATTQATALSPPPVNGASPAPTVSAVAPNEDAPNAGPTAADAARNAAQSARDHCKSGYPTPDCYAAFPEKVTCPGQRADVPAGEYCGLEGRTQPAMCPYATATCTCRHIPYCGGVTPTQLQQMGMIWVCAPPRKAGDCPEAAARGGHCSSAGQLCTYGSCGSLTACTCSAGKYQCQDRLQQTPP